MKEESKSWKRYSSCVTINHCLLTFLIVISCVNYSHGFLLWSADFKRLCFRPNLICDTSTSYICRINNCDASNERPCPNVTTTPKVTTASMNESAPDCMNSECPLSYKNKALASRCAQIVDSNSKLKYACRHNIKKPLIAFSTLDGLYETRLPVDRSKIQVNETLQQINLTEISAFDYDNCDDLFIWLDESGYNIFWGKFVQTDKVEIHERRVAVNVTHINTYNMIHGFAYDWKNQAIIWIDDYGISSKRLYYEMEQPKLYRTLDLDKDYPEAITIDVKKRLIFWMNTGDGLERSINLPYIERIDIRGEPKTKKIVETNIVRPVGLAIDTRQKKVYWMDGLNFHSTLNSIGYDGTNRIILREYLPYINELISMDIFSNYLYFTDKINSTIQRININNAVKKVDTLISVPNGPPTWIKIINPMSMFWGEFFVFSFEEM